MKKILTSLILVASGLAFAQVGISKDNTDPQATLDVRALGKSDVADGILVPRVEKQKAQDMATNKTANHLQESTLIYITDGDSTVTGTAVADVDAKGFYYFDGTKWVKIGAGSSSSGLTTPLKFTDYKDNVTVKKVTTLALTDWKENDFMKVLMNGFSGAVNLPDPSKNKGRLISVQNISGGLLNYAANHPENVGVIGTQRSHLLISDGSNWFIVGGLGM